ncbi:adenosylcobinamide-GDP ribazoletransferase [Pseudonocardia sp. TRM90224]|uniref:adenosylcobinamide-GDP ribazoletransferase n=1 Tax=Pseudonocardia sp. TRM90224 TaxID=2812678 RepID=UPI001E2F1300|nr:adenosylcobinamide-GDP ribazoletransferase [Pseudonocardia sp. TRM90224]
MKGLALAVSWLTVLPVRTGAPDRRAAAAAIRWAPIVGALLGLVAAGAGLGLTALGVAPLAAGLLAVAVLALATRGMHLDGLADTADGLGCYGPPERALAVMRDGGAGPFAVVTLVVVIGLQAVAFAQLSGYRPGYVLGAVVLAVATGRAAFGWMCRRGVAAARPDGLGATVAGSQPWWVPVLWWIALGALAYPVLGWRGPVAVGLAAVITVLLSWHTARRFGGVTGDPLGAAAELSTAAVLLITAAA